MSSVFLPLPFCYHCSAIRVGEQEGEWLRYDGKVAKTTTKLDTCARCHIARYCGEECQKGHWLAHKSNCKTPGREITPQEVDGIVNADVVAGIQPGWVKFYLDPNLKVMFVDCSIEKGIGMMSVEVEISKKTLKSYHYLLCKAQENARNVARDSSNNLRKVVKAASGLHSGIERFVVGTALALIYEGLYEEAFALMTSKVDHPQFLTESYVFAIERIKEAGCSIESIATLIDECHLSGKYLAMIFAALTRRSLHEEAKAIALLIP